MAMGSVKQTPVRFSGTLEELQQEFKRLEEEKKFNLLNQQCEKSNRLLTEKIITINNRPLSGLEFLEVINSKALAGRKIARLVGAGIATPVGLGIGALVALGVGWPALILAPVVSNGISYFVPEVRYGYVIPKSITSLSHSQANAVSEYDVTNAFNKLMDAGLLDRHEVKNEYGSHLYYYYTVTKLGQTLLADQSKLNAEQLFKRKHTQVEATAEAKKANKTTQGAAAKAKAAATPQEQQNRLQLIKTLTSQSPSESFNGYELLSKVIQAYDKRFPYGRMLAKGITDLDLMKHIAPSDSQTTRRQLNALVSLGLITKLETTAKGPAEQKNELWVIESRGRSILKQGDPSKNGSVSEEDMTAILQLEIDRLEESKKEKLSQFQAIEGQYQQLLQAMGDLEKQIKSLTQQLTPLAEKAEKETDDISKRKQLREIKLQKVHLDRLENQHRIQGELAQRLKLEMEGKDLLLAKWNERVEHDISDLMECQIKIKVLKAEQSITQVIQSIQQIEQKQLDGSRLFDQEAQWLTQQIQGQYQRTKEPDALEAQKLDLATEKALEAELLRSETADVLKEITLKENTQKPSQNKQGQ